MLSLARRTVSIVRSNTFTASFSVSTVNSAAAATKARAAKATTTKSRAVKADATAKSKKPLKQKTASATEKAITAEREKRAKAVAAKAKAVAAEKQKKEKAAVKKAAAKLHEQIYTFKRPLNPNAIFIGERLKNRAAGARVQDVFRAASEEWKELTDAQKQPFQDKYAIQKVKYDQQVASVPKRPVTDFAKYVQQNYSTVKLDHPAEEKASNLLKKLAEGWRALSVAEKESYKASKHEFDAYHAAKERFEASRKIEIGA
ncbi:hypothetical protein BABINDRAFT_159562 [Babjeviella inositovora NRRL Y-12698]|uniref:HMG box domain-containing protein n=1 Tax=Babjeviella inositovora NRRL Y-12698 TaxID=984486 RepID=A0A1E3QZY2_9ASCO|nr:uncharacterized protein BABINDRAFT_159562 [Babjeviella inositovora NRRL Y-12698]ODQ83104.1 hypothetical protein BABINDRAFT_159562 [Babjeviella inositovora NRRL Y-12698]